MCMFCAAMPAVAAATATVAQREKRKQLTEGSTPKPIVSRRGRVGLTPLCLSQCGALIFIGLLVAPGFYHTHFPG